MKQLPTEVLRDIFLLLDLYDQLECMFTCRHWKHAVEMFGLFQTIYLYTEDCLDSLIEKIEQTPAITRRVDRIVMDLGLTYDSTNRNRLLALLPNLQVLQSAGPDLEFEFEEKLEYQWHKTIRHMSEFGGLPVTFHLLYLSTCPNLISLEIEGSVAAIIPLLKNAPALKYLMIGGEQYSFSFDDLESIHASLTQLVSIYIKCNFKHFTRYHGMIEPANSAVEFTIERVLLSEEDEEEEEQVHGRVLNYTILDYITKKYPNIVKLGYDLDIYERGMDSYTSGWIPFLRKTGPQLKKLGITCPDYDSVVTYLNENSCQVNDLEINFSTIKWFRRFVQYPEIYFIQRLHIRIKKEYAFEWLEKLDVLEKLTLDDEYHYGHGTIKLNELLLNCPSSLKSLSLRRLSLSCDHKYIGPPLNVETLSFRDICLPSNTNTFIARHFLKLTSLKIKKCSNFNGKVFNMPRIRLSSLHFVPEYETNDLHVIIITLENNKMCRYSAREQKRPIRIKELRQAFDGFIYTTPKLETDTETLPQLTLICKSLENVIITRSPKEI